MKRKHLLIVSIVLLFVSLSMIAGLWMAHTRFINSGIAALSENLQSRSLKLEHTPITFSKNAIFDIYADIKTLTLSYEAAGKSLITYTIDDVKIHSNMWKGELTIEIIGDIKSKLHNDQKQSILQFTSHPMIKMSFKDIFTRAWSSKDLIQTIELYPVGYSVINSSDSSMKPFSSIESAHVILQKPNMDEENAPWHLKATILNQQYFAKDSDEDLYKLMETTGATSLSIDCIISTPLPSKEVTEAIKSIIQINELKASTKLFATEIRGNVQTFQKHKIPNLDLNIKLYNVENIVSYYYKVFDTLSKINKPSDQSKGTDTSQTELVNEIVKFIKTLSLSDGSETIDLTIQLDQDKFLISGVSADKILREVSALASNIDTKTKIRKK